MMSRSAVNSVRGCNVRSRKALCSRLASAKAFLLAASASTAGATASLMGSEAAADFPALFISAATLVSEAAVSEVDASKDVRSVDFTAFAAVDAFCCSEAESPNLLSFSIIT